MLLRACVTAVLLAAVCQATSSRARAQNAEAPLTNASVVKLVRAGFREKTVIAIIRTRQAAFDLSPERLIELKRGGVSERVILAMLAHQAPAEVTEEGWSDDEEFFGTRRGGAGGAPGQGEPGGVDIFGSSGGARGSVRSRGGNGGLENDTQTTGSATVRILRPPVEAGGAPEAKMERTPTLTNDSVVGMVEAGFSEGTIIRRVEQSPADFDLSPAKLAELRRRRVTEPVIAAMRAAMGESEATQTPRQ